MPFISLNNINWLVFLMDTNCVLCEIGTAVLHTLDECHSCGCTIAQVVSCQPLAMEALVLFQPVHMRVFIDKVAIGQFFLKNLRFCLLSISFH